VILELSRNPKTENYQTNLIGQVMGNLMVLLHIGSMPHELTLKNIDLFSRKVMPHVRDIWDDELGEPLVARDIACQARLADRGCPNRRLSSLEPVILRNEESGAAGALDRLQVARAPAAAWTPPRIGGTGA